MSNLTDPTIWIHVTGAFCALLIVLSVPLAVVSIRLDKKNAERALRPVPLAHPSRRAKKVREKFIANNVRLTTFGDKRRVTFVVTEIIRPETGAIPLPNAHVPVTSRKFYKPGVKNAKPENRVNLEKI